MRNNVLQFMVLIFVVLLASSSSANLLQITVETDKDVYQFGEDVLISVVAYNPNPEEVNLTGGFYFNTYIIDDIYDWADGRSGPAVIIKTTVDPGESLIWEQVHGIHERSAFPLEIGTHTVVGEVLAFELQGQSRSEPVEFEVVPEPASILLLLAGVPVMRKLKT